jgi:hypothetical protein
MSIPTHEQTAGAPVDALLIAGQFWRDDDKTTPVLLKHCDPWSVILQLTGWLRASVRETLARGGGEPFGDKDEFDVLDRWLTQVRSEAENA